MKSSVLSVLTVLTLAGGAVAAEPMGTTFTYHGRLAQTACGQPTLNGVYEMRLRLYDSWTGGAQQGPELTRTVPVTNGLFMTTLNFGAGVFIGDARWLELEVRTNSPAEPFVPLSPRQELKPTPYALFADAAKKADTLSGNPSITGTVTFDRATGAPFVVKSTDKVEKLNADLLDGLDSTSLWKLAGNAGIRPGTDFLGTTDNQPLEFRVKGRRALRLAPTDSSPNVVAGDAGNTVADGVMGATIAGGGEWATGALHANEVNADFGTVGGGKNNRIDPESTFATIGGGYSISIEDNSLSSTVSGGYLNFVYANSPFTTIGGGTRNVIRADTPNATVAGGTNNVIQSQATAATIGGGRGNVLGTNAQSSTIAGGELNEINRSVDASFGIIYDSLRSVIGGGLRNKILGAAHGVIAGGRDNQVWGDFGMVAGGDLNIANTYSFAAGRRAKATHAGSFVWADSQNADFLSTSSDEFAVRARSGARIHSPILEVKGSGNERAYLGGDGAGSDVQIGSQNAAIQNVAVYNTGSDSYMNLFVKSLTITGGADLAEPFAMSETEIMPGSVVVIDEQNAGRLKLSRQAHDHRVAGIVSGAQGIQPGISMIQAEKLEAGRNVALSGRVYALADASDAPIQPGDLLTTSDTPGHAMKVTDPAKAQGAILGKAMSSLDQGRGMVLVLVSLQ